MPRKHKHARPVHRQAPQATPPRRPEAFAPGIGKTAPLWAVLAVVAVVQFFTMPRFFYPGDNFAPRIEALDIVLNRRFGIPFAERDTLGGLVDERGQYFYENDKQGKLYSKYGIANTLMMLPPALVDTWVNGPPAGPLEHRDSLLFWVNVYQVLLSVAGAAYLFLLVSLFTRRTGLRVGFTLATLYTTYVWYYLRAPALEIFQIPAFLGMLYHLFRYTRRAAEPGGRETSRTWRHLAIAMGFGGYLVLLKSVFAVTVAIGALFAVCAGEPGIRLPQRLAHALGRYFKRFALYGALPVLVCLAILLLANALRYGSPFEMGYGQHIRSGVPHDQIALRFLPVSLPRFLYRPGNANIFLTYLPFFAAVPSMFWMLWRRRGEGMFLAALFAANLFMMSIYSCWSGEWCYGPRYLFLFLIAGSLPLVPALEALLDRRPAAARAALIALLPLAAYGLRMQMQVNSIHYFAYHYIEQFFRDPFDQIPEVREYQRRFDRWGRGILYRDIRRHAANRQTFPPFEAVARRIPPQHPQRDQILGQYDAMLRHFGQRNYFFFRDGGS